MNTPHRTQPSRNARDQLIRRRPWGQLGEPPQVLCDSREGEFELGAAGTPETQSDETQDALQVGEQHLDLFAIVTRLRIGFGFATRPGNIASLFIDAARDFTHRGTSKNSFWSSD